MNLSLLLATFVVLVLIAAERAQASNCDGGCPYGSCKQDLDPLTGDVLSEKCVCDWSCDLYSKEKRCFSDYSKKVPICYHVSKACTRALASPTKHHEDIYFRKPARRKSCSKLDYTDSNRVCVNQDYCAGNGICAIRASDNQRYCICDKEHRGNRCMLMASKRELILNHSLATQSKIGLIVVAVAVALMVVGCIVIVVQRIRHTRQRHCSLDEDEEASVASTSPGEAAASSGYNNNNGEKQNHGHKNNKADETSRLCEK